MKIRNGENKPNLYDRSNNTAICYLAGLSEAADHGPKDLTVVKLNSPQELSIT